MGVLAYNLLHMIRQFNVWGEEVKRSMDWLIKRLIKVRARVSYHADGGISMWPPLFPWLTITERCWPGVLRPNGFEVSGLEEWYAKFL
jgi:hypothetical protein